MSHCSSFLIVDTYHKNEVCFAGINHNSNSHIVIEFEKMENTKHKLTREESLKYIKDLLGFLGISEKELTLYSDIGYKINVTGYNKSQKVFIGTVIRTLYENYNTVHEESGDFYKIAIYYHQIRKAYPTKSKFKCFVLAYNMYIVLEENRFSYLYTGHSILSTYQLLAIKDRDFTKILAALKTRSGFQVLMKETGHVLKDVNFETSRKVKAKLDLKYADFLETPKGFCSKFLSICKEMADEDQKWVFTY